MVALVKYQSNNLYKIKGNKYMCKDYKKPAQLRQETYTTKVSEFFILFYFFTYLNILLVKKS
jgi:hypothetical protein